MDVFYVRHHIPDPGLAYGYAFCLVEGVIIAALLALSLIVKFVRHSREATWVRCSPSSSPKTSAYLADADVLEELRQMRRRHPREMEICISELLLACRARRAYAFRASPWSSAWCTKWVREYRSRRASRRRDAVSRLGILDGGAGTATVLLAPPGPQRRG